ncbi:GNAT family N-acetyltransferase [Rhodobacter sp. Har01]|uniref:GNAT family N-acyltransferase n=1 Tax=Rhodobacter sp. Har01 TaxID=2883999 RepID=UPI001D08AC5F|nr:GNAT family N-acyltransferase [Rhodobacter sp. Har01]MCB6177037.1 GNAT family N-acetyltransferase [Rhodobacter sp. Har01]
MQPLIRGRYVARLAEGPADIARMLALRGAVFRAGGDDADALDARCRHVLVEGAGGTLCGGFRVAILQSAALEQGYAAQFYDLAPLAGDARPSVEMGRFCLAPGLADPDVLRLAWAAMTQIVDAAGAGRMIGCTSFAGADWQPHRAALALLADRHLGPVGLRPGRRAAEVVEFPALAGPVTDRTAALAGLPPLLRSYLGMGGWVSDHAVADRDLDTLHVFTCVEVDGVPAARAASLRAVARD